MDQNKENFVHRHFLSVKETTLITQRLAIRMAPKNWELGDYSEHGKLSVFGPPIGLKLIKKSE